jgi:hypothetical protein
MIAVQLGYCLPLKLDLAIKLFACVCMRMHAYFTVLLAEFDVLFLFLVGVLLTLEVELTSSQ